MIRLALLYPVLCFVLFGAHLLFHGLGLPVALSVLVPSTLLFVRSVWSPRICGFLLVLAGCEWEPPAERFFPECWAQVRSGAAAYCWDWY